MPTELKRLRGNPGHQKLPDAANVVLLPAIDDIPDPPRPLGPEGRKLWDRIWDSGRAWISPGSDLDLVLLACETMDERVMLRVHVLRGGDDFDWRDRVALRVLDEQVRSLLQLLAFTPVDRNRLGVAEVKRATALEQLLDSKG